jgi:hypothetical protein
VIGGHVERYPEVLIRVVADIVGFGNGQMMARMEPLRFSCAVPVQLMTSPGV